MILEIEVEKGASLHDVAKACGWDVEKLIEANHGMALSKGDQIWCQIMRSYVQSLQDRRSLVDVYELECKLCLCKLFYVYFPLLQISIQKTINL